MKRVSPFNLPNLLTTGRVVAVPAVVACMFWPEEYWMRWVALGIFVLAAITDYLDGYLARAWSQQSALGRMLDPIADKLLVAATLLMLVADRLLPDWPARAFREPDWRADNLLAAAVGDQSEPAAESIGSP